MRIITQSAIDISESLAAYMLSSYIYQDKGYDVTLEKRLNYVNTGQFSRADIYYSEKDMAVEVKSIAHGNDALKGVLQASMYKEQTENSIFCMQTPRRNALRETLEGMCETYGVGLVYIDGIPNICSKDNIDEATGGCSKPFELWKDRTFTRTRDKIIANSRSGWANEYVNTLDQVIYEYAAEIFNFKIEPDSNTDGLAELHGTDESTHTVGDF